MFTLQQPSESHIRDYLARQSHQSFSYNLVGCTRDQPAAHRGWKVDHHRVQLGQGPDVFARARDAIDTWQMFPAEIATVFGHEVPRDNLLVAVLYRFSVLPLWLLMPARVVYTINDTDMRDGHTIKRYGFAYGTLPDPPGGAQWRFWSEWTPADAGVHYDLWATSPPRHFLARLAFPFTRYEQGRFRRLSGMAMQRAAISHSATAKRPN